MAQIKDLNTGDKFKFSGMVYTVKQKFFDWKKDNNPYLTTINCMNFSNGELEVDVINNKK